MEEVIIDTEFDRLFTEENFRRIFKERLLGRNGGGRDRMTPDTYLLRYPKDFKEVPIRCLNGTFHFSNYNERLILKGRGKIPRVISVPSVRDRLVLAVLNQYLQNKYAKEYWSRSANERVRSVQNFKVKSGSKEVTYIKTDFKAFYDSIHRPVLLKILKNKAIDSRAYALIENAILTPTTASGQTDIEELPEFGIPQGLAISNILSDIYLEEFDSYAVDQCEVYIRYVDDIVFLQPKGDNLIDNLNEFIAKRNMNLVFHPEKIKYGILSKNHMDFLGYEFTEKGTTVRHSNVTSFFNRIAKECLNFKKQFEKKGLRPAYLYDDEKYLNTRIELLNLSITGIKVQGKYYGWMHHYQQIDDIGLLSMIDRKIRNTFLGFLPKDRLSGLKSLKRMYYIILGGQVDKEVFDYDNLSTAAQQRAYLQKLGRLDPDIDYSDKDILEKYTQHRDLMRKKMEAHIGRKS